MPETMAAPMASKIPSGPTGPATVPPVSNGLRQRAALLAPAVSKALMHMVQLEGAQTAAGRDLLKCVMSLSKLYGESSGDLQRQEMKLLNERANPVGQQNPQQQAAMGAAMKLQGLGMSPSPSPAPSGAGGSE